MNSIWILIYALALCVKGFASNPLNLLEIDLTTRGKYFSNYFSSLNMNGSAEIAIQTMSSYPYTNSPFIVNGVIPYVTSLAITPYYTLFLVTYFPSNANQKQYVIVGIEQITEMIYYPTTPPYIPTSTGYFASYPTSLLPLYQIDATARAADFAFATSLLLKSPYATQVSQVWIQTNINGPFYVPFIQGMIPNVQSITANGNLLSITYINPYLSGFIGSVTVPVEQIQQTIYYLTPPNIRP